MQRPQDRPTPGGAAEPDSLYFARRAEEEERAAEQASNEAVAQVHRGLARKYAALAATARDRAARGGNAEGET